MANNFTKDIFKSTYKDDFSDSDNYHRILFNNGRALQARELTQMQTITQKEISRLGRHVFREGAAVNPGGVTINNNYEFIKIVGELPSASLVGTQLTSTTNNVIVEVLETVARVSDAEPATLYVRYVSTSSGTSGTTPVRITAGHVLSGGGESVTVQSINTVANPAVGTGTKVSVHQGDFFAVDRFVFAKEQSMILSKYTSDPDAIIGFKVIQDIVSVSDFDALYDNSGSTPNRSSPGADRYRIRLTLTDQANIASDESFVYVAKIVDGKVATQVEAADSYNVLEDRLALRTNEESGNYIAKRFAVSFDTNDSDNTQLDFDITPGVAYVDGYRAVVDAPLKIQVDKPRTTSTSNNEVIAANFGQYVITSGNKGLPNIDEFEEVTLFPNAAGTGTAIGTARVRSIQQDGSNYRIYLFDIKIASGKNKRNTKSIGTNSTNYNTLVLENSKAVFKDEQATSMLFPLPSGRPKILTDINFTVQRRRTATFSSGSANIALTAAGETFADTTDWVASPVNGTVDTSFTADGASGTSSNLTSSADGSYEIITYVNKSQGLVRTKTLTEVTETITPDADGNLNFTKADVFEIIRVTNTDSDGTSVKAIYNTDDGQRDFGYLNGRLVKKSGASTPSGDVFVRYKHFVHGASGDFFAVNSYTGQVDYENIPSYTQENGTKVSLRDVIDFRSSVNSSGNFGSGARVNEVPKNTGLVNFDAEYYMGKNVRVVIDRQSNVTAIEGDPSINPQLPPIPNNSMDLFHVVMNPFTISDADISSKTITAKRFTMQDIGKLENRVDRLEETTALSLLELETTTFAVLDAAGNNRTQSGFFVDNFADNARSLITSDYRASVDPEAKLMRPWFSEANIRMLYDSAQSDNTVLKGDSVYLNYTNTNYVDQAQATEKMNINPFAVVLNEGFVELSPSSDEWTEVNQVADRVEDGGTRLNRGTSVLWNNWRWNWVGREDELQVGQEVDRTVVGNTTRIDRVVAAETVREFVNDRILDVAFIPFMRSKKVAFRAFGLKPSTQVYAFFNNKPVSNWVRSEGAFNRFAGTTEDFGQKYKNATAHPDGATALTTDAEGALNGSFFIPSTSAEKFRTGTREFKLLDISIPNDAGATSIAKTPFTSTGIIETRQSTFTSTRVLTIGGTTNRRRGRAIDPLAQTFFIEEDDGIFVTRIGVRFASKDSVVPVICQIRPTVNGIPSADDIIPNGVKVLSPSNISVSSDASSVTYFDFDEPVYLNGQVEYSIVLLADTTAYEVYVAKAGDLKFGSTEIRVTKQPTLGSLFKSQNSRTWTPDQERDLTFTIDRAKFDTDGGYIIAENANTPVMALDTDPIEVTNASGTVKVFASGHGFTVGDEVTFTGVPAIGGIAAANINGARSVTKVDGYGFEFVAGASDVASSTTVGGGDDITITRQMMMDTVLPYFEVLSPPKTLTVHSAKYTSGKSFAGINETAYQKDAAFLPVANRSNNEFQKPALVASSANEVSNLGSGVKSVSHKIKMVTSSDRVSPVIDMQRASITAVSNLIDKQVASGNGGNIPIEYIAETNPSGGSHLAKHITQPVSLAESAVGIKILLGANRPSVADFDVYYRTNTSDADANGQLLDSVWIKVDKETAVPSDENTNVFREYRYLVGGDGGTMDAFNQMQMKIVMTSTNSSRPPLFKDLRIIALSV